jgi:signal transduction histidine kinase
MPSLSLRRMVISLALAVLAAVSLFAINETGYKRSNIALAGIAEASQTHSSLNRLLQRVLDAETGSRGFLLTGDPRYLQPYESAVAGIGEDIQALQLIYTAQDEEHATVEELLRNVNRRLSELELSVQMRKEGNADAWKFVLTTDVGKQHMDAIRAQAGTLIELSAASMEASQAQVERSLLLARLGIATVALAGLLAFYLYLRQTTALDRAGARQKEILQRERDLLERQVRERTASLAELATHLQQVREQERGHLARELHDELGALLTAAKLDVARLKSRLGSTAPEVGQRLQHLTDTLNSGIALKRRIIEDLRPSSLFNLGLTASLEILSREFSDQSGVETILELEPVELEESRQLTVYRLVQESLTNVTKYAEATQVTISVAAHAGDVVVTVRDDGRGFDVTQTRPSTHGLAGMRHRVEAAGGKLSVLSNPGKGTCISARLPGKATTA